MRKLVLFLFVVGTFQSGIAQSNKKNQETDIVSHQVQLGETIRTISKKYLVDPAEIYKLNKFATEGIQQGMVLQIPVPRKQEVYKEDNDASRESPSSPENHSIATEPTSTTRRAAVAVPPKEGINITYPSEHVVSSGETLYSLSRQYNVAVSDIQAANEEVLKNGLKVGQVIKIPSKDNVSSIGQISNNESSIVSESVKSAQAGVEIHKEADVSNTITIGNPITHIVAPKETLYSLSKKYGVTVDEIKAQNPEVQQYGLQIGQTLTITKN